MRVGSCTETTAPNEPATKLETGSHTILIVEDDAALLQVTRRSLEEAGYTIFAAASGAKAMHISENHLGPIHLMVTDVIMPRMSGTDLGASISRRRQEMNVLFVSGYTDNAIVHHGVLEPGLAFLQKPFSPKTLARKVSEVLTVVSTISVISEP